jgi:hypothetical protein
MRTVGPDDEWCAEAFMETDYTQLSRSDFETALRNYTVFRLLYDAGKDADESED